MLEALGYVNREVVGASDGVGSMEAADRTMEIVASYDTVDGALKWQPEICRVCMDVAQVEYYSPTQTWPSPCAFVLSCYFLIALVNFLE